MSDSFEFRAAQPAEYASLLRIWRRTYGENWSDDPAEAPPHQQLFIGQADGKAVFACSIFDFPMYVRGAFLRCAGVAGVATLPESRGGGFASQAMESLLKECYRQGYDLAALYGFRDPFYRKFGYASCGWRWQIACPVSRLPKVSRSLPVREVSPQNLESLNECYQKFAQNLNGACIRTPDHWRRRMGKNPPAIYAVGDPVEGYLWTNVAGFWNDQEIGEMAWSTPEGHASLLALMREFGANKSKIVWTEPPISPYLAYHIDSEVEVRRHRHTMFRVVNAREVLQTLGGFSFSFELNDPVIEENCEPIGSGPNVRLGISAFTQGIMGDPGFGQLIRDGKVQVLSEAQSELEKQFPPHPVCCMEFF